MGEKLLTTIVSVISAIIVVAIIALLVSKKSATASVLQAGGNAFSSVLNSAFGPGYGNRVGLPYLPTITIS